MKLPIGPTILRGFQDAFRFTAAYPLTIAAFVLIDFLVFELDYYFWGQTQTFFFLLFGRSDLLEFIYFDVPAAIISVPVMKEASSEARNRARAAISPGLPRRLNATD